MGKIASVNCRENKVITPFSPASPCVSLLIPVSSSVMVKNEAPYAASCSFFLIEVSDFSPAAHLRKTDDNAVGVIYCDFTKMNMSSAFSSCKCGCAEKKKLSLLLPPLLGEQFLQHYKERLPVTEWFNSLSVNVNLPFTIAITVIIICFGYNTIFNMILSVARPRFGLQRHCAATVRLIGTHHHYWTVSTVT